MPRTGSISLRQMQAILGKLSPIPDGLTGGRKLEIAAALNRIVSAYRFRRAEELAAPNNLAVRESMQKLQKTAQALSSVLRELDPSARRALASEAAEYASEATASFRQVGFDTDDRTRRIARGRDDLPPLSDDWLGGQRLRLLTAIVRDCRRWASSVSRKVDVKPGPKLNTALLRMVYELAELYIAHTGASFSRSSKRGSPRFFVDAVTSVADPDIRPGQFDEAMRAILPKKKQKGAVGK